MLNLPELVGAVQKNCDISDAQHARDYGLCTYLLKMREYYRWEHELPFFHKLPKDELGSWLDAREALWTELEASDYQAVPLESGRYNPFETESINHELVPRGYVYSGGYGRFQKPHFFLGELLRGEQRDGYTVLVSTCEYARDLVAPPAMLLGRTIFVRLESVRRLLWEKYDQWQWNDKQNQAMARAFECYDFANSRETALERMAHNEAEAMILHELGEGRAGELLGESWEQMLLAVAGTRAELIARAVRDHLADCLSTLPTLVAREHHCSLHFFFGNFDGMRQELFPQAKDTYKEWVRDDTLTRRLASLADQGQAHWLRVARSFVDAFADDPSGMRAFIESAKIVK